MVTTRIQRISRALGIQNLLKGAQVDESTVYNVKRPIRPEVSDERYISWLEEHPSALTSFDQIMASMETKQIVLFLDYDGTLSPIVDDPNLAFMSEPMRLALREVAKFFPTAIISGRSRKRVYEFVKLDEVYYAGSHGMDLMGPPLNVKSYEGKYQINTHDEQGNEITIFQPAKEYLPSISKMIEELKKRTSHIPGALVEDNRFCISVHYRHVMDEDYVTLEEIVRDVLLEYSSFHITRGKKVLEIRPSIKWNKGNALVYLLETIGFSNDSTNVIPFYLGDDKTDEDAFKVLENRGQGYPIVVTSVPRETVASHSLRDPSEVLSFLIHLAEWKKALQT